MNFLFVIWSLVRLSFRNDSVSTLVFKNLFGQSSFRDQANISSSRLPVVFLRQALSKLLTARSIENGSLKRQVVLFDSNLKSAQSRILYLAEIESLKRPTLITVRSDLRLSFLDKLIGGAFISLFFAVTFFFVKCPTKRRASSIFLLEIVEIASLMGVVKGQVIDELYFFNAYEKDSNFIGYLLLKLSCPFIKIPSPNPISRMYSHVLTDRFAITAPYQKNEHENLKENWVCVRLLEFPTFNVHKLKNYTRQGVSSYQYDLGYISSGMWLRKELGHSMVESSLVDSEVTLLNYLKTHWSKSILISLHPLEKKKENLERSKSYYFEQFGENASYMDFDQPTLAQFHLVNLTITAHSSTNMERLSCGYKALFAPVYWKESVFQKDAQLRNISVLSEGDFLHHIGHDLQISEEAFFKLYDLEEYQLKLLEMS
jgi:hypothetical protein